MGATIDTPLQTRQKAFVHAYIGNGYNGTQAAKAVGYSPISACQMATENLSKPHIKAYLVKCMKELAIEMGITPEWKYKLLKECAEACMDGRADREGRINPSGLNTTIANINKMDGTYLAQAKEMAKFNPENVDEMIKEFQKDY